MFNDKKTHNGVINIVALNEIGKAYVDKSASSDEIESALEYIIE